jgi:sec-independent protein translocase protein TatA
VYNQGAFDLDNLKRQEVQMGRIGIPELLIILLILMVIFGANRLPEIGRGIGKAIKNFKEAGKEESEER